MDDKDDPPDVARAGVEASLAGKASGTEIGTHLPDAVTRPWWRG